MAIAATVPIIVSSENASLQMAMKNAIATDAALNLRDTTISFILQSTQMQTMSETT